jgi:hypothetical protein
MGSASAATGRSSPKTVRLLRRRPTATGGLRALLAPQIRTGDARWLFLVIVDPLLAVLIIGDRGRIDRDSTWLRVLTGTLIGFISLVNAGAAVRLVIGIIGAVPFTSDANVLLVSGGAVWLTNVIAFGLWYWDLDRGGAAARARGSGRRPAFVFPEMTNSQYVEPDWYPRFVDYLHLSFTTATAFSPTDVSAIRPWAKLMMMARAGHPARRGVLPRLQIRASTGCPLTESGRAADHSELVSLD